VANEPISQLLPFAWPLRGATRCCCWKIGSMRLSGHMGPIRASRASWDGLLSAKEDSTMATRSGRTTSLPNIPKAKGEEPLFRADDDVKIARRFPIGHFRVPSTTRTKATGETPAKSDTIIVSPSRSPNCGRNTRALRMTACVSRFSKPGWKGVEQWIRIVTTTPLFPMQAA
jgi:hypothetical protein